MILVLDQRTEGGGKLAQRANRTFLVCLIYSYLTHMLSILIQTMWKKVSKYLYHITYTDPIYAGCVFKTISLLFLRPAMRSSYFENSKRIMILHTYYYIQGRGSGTECYRMRQTGLKWLWKPTMWVWDLDRLGYILFARLITSYCMFILITCAERYPNRLGFSSDLRLSRCHRIVELKFTSPPTQGLRSSGQLRSPLTALQLGTYPSSERCWAGSASLIVLHPRN